MLIHSLRSNSNLVRIKTNSQLMYQNLRYFSSEMGPKNPRILINTKYEQLDIPPSMKEVLLDEDRAGDASDLPFLFLNQTSWLEQE